MKYKVVRILDDGTEADVTSYQSLAKCQSMMNSFQRMYRHAKYKIVEVKS